MSETDRIIKARRMAALFCLVVALALTPAMSGCGRGASRQYIQLFQRNGKVYVLAGDGALYNLTLSGRAIQPETFMPAGENTGVLAGDRYFYISGRRLMAYHLAQLKSSLLYEAGANDILTLQLALPDRVVFSTVTRQGGAFGAPVFFSLELATGLVTPLLGPPFTEGRSLTFLAWFGDHYYFADKKETRLAAISLQDRVVDDLSAQVEFTPTHACISNGQLYLNAWRKALYIVEDTHTAVLPSGEGEAGGGSRPGAAGPNDRQPVVRRVMLPTEIGDPGAMAPYPDGILLCEDDPVHNAVIYQVSDVDPKTGEGFQLARMTDPERFIAWNVWQLAVHGDRFYCIAGTGKTLVAGMLGTARR